MKKLFASVLALCLLCCSFALAEEAPELSWEDTLSSNPDLAANGSDQTITVDGVGTILYWVPGNLPAIDVNQSGTHREEMLRTPNEFQAITTLRSFLADLNPVTAMEMLTKRLGKTESNEKFLESLN